MKKYFILLLLLSSTAWGTDVCLRTEQIKVYLERSLEKPCEQMTDADLLNLKSVGAWFNGAKIESLQAFDFYGWNKLWIIDLNFNRLQNLPNELFRESESLQHLYLDSNYLSELSPVLFENLVNLKTLSIQQNNLKRLEPETFAHLKSLEKLDLSDNYYLTQIDVRAFIGLENLKTLDLTKTGFSPTDTNIFAELKNLQRLELSQNEIKELSPGIFSKLNGGLFLNLSFNSLEKISPDIFSDQNFSPKSRVCLAGNKKLSLENREALRSQLGDRVSFDLFCRF